MSVLVSAIIPTYNRAALLRKALRSVVDQTYRPIEVVVIDDGSTDDTPCVLEHYKTVLADAGIKLIVHHQQNQRAPAARNVGMKLATGSIYAFLDSDDVWLPEYVATLAGLLEKHPSAALAFCSILGIDYDDKVFAERETRLPRDPGEGILSRPFNRIIRYMPMQTSGVMVRRSVIEKVGDFDLSLPVVEDWDLWYRISKQYDFAYTVKALACNRQHPSNLPKFDTLALSGNLKMNLKHLPDVTDSESRRILCERIRKQTLLFQEQLLREGVEANGMHSLLEHILAPADTRFELGTLMREQPAWVGQAYGWLVRALGELKRST